MDPGQAGGGGRTELPVEVPGAPRPPRPQASKDWGAGEGGGVPEDLCAPGPSQGVRSRGGESVAEHKLTLQSPPRPPRHGRPRAGGGEGGAGVAVLPHPLGELVEVRADDERQLGPGGRGLGAGARLPPGQREAGGAPGRGRGGGLRPGQGAGVVRARAEHSVLVEHWVVHPPVDHCYYTH